MLGNPLELKLDIRISEYDTAMKLLQGDGVLGLVELVHLTLCEVESLRTEVRLLEAQNGILNTTLELSKDLAKLINTNKE